MQTEDIVGDGESQMPRHKIILDRMRDRDITTDNLYRHKYARADCKTHKHTYIHRTQSEKHERSRRLETH